MKRNILCTLFAVFFLMTACSHHNVITPPGEDNPEINSSDNSSRQFLGYYTVNLNPETQNGVITQNRSLNAHLNVEGFLTGWPCSDCLRITNLHFLPGNQVMCDIEVVHPIAMAVYTVFDLRVIAIFPADEYFYGVGVSYALLNRDGLTAIWDNPAIPGSINGFMAYHKEDFRRSFGPGTAYEETFIVQLPSGPLQFDIGVDASWAPNDGVNFPIHMNSFEVIDLHAEATTGLTDKGGSATIIAEMYDYQGRYTISSVTAYSDDLFITPVQLEYSHGDGFSATYEAEITNEKNAAIGIYDVLIKVTDMEDVNYPEDISAYQTTEVTVVDGGVQITLDEDADYKTPGNYYIFDSYAGSADHNLIDYFDTDGPWDFTSVTYSGTAQRSILDPSDPEITGFSSEFPTADHFVKNDGNFGLTEGLYYQPELHDPVTQSVIPLGFHEEDHFGGTWVYDNPTSGFPYPVTIDTSYDIQFESGWFTTVSYDTEVLGMGMCEIPLNGGSEIRVLMIRTIIEVSLIYPIAKAITYEWYDDDGNLLALIVGTNLAGQDPQWLEDTNEIMYGGVLALTDMYRQ